MTKPALFLDRDGVINVDHGYVYRPEDVEFINGIFELVVAANEAGYMVVVVTNQAGIGRGYYSEAQFHALTAWMKARFSEQGGHLDAVYFCPFHPEHGIGEYRRESDCRKPAPGMLLQAWRELNIDLANSILVGDKATDMMAGQAAGVGTLLHLGGVENDAKVVPIQALGAVLPYFSISSNSISNGTAASSLI
jgi:D-glycero-D-manno-heptose 1,7-bisphosphate phosphatase